MNNLLKNKSSVYKFVNNICCVFLSIQVIVVSVVVFGRYVLNKTPGWGERTALLCMVWFSLLSVSLAISDSRHLKMTLAEMYLPKKFNICMKYINYIIFIIFALFMIIEGTKLSMLVSKSIIPGLNISSSFLYASIPVSGLTILFAVIGKILKREEI